MASSILLIADDLTGAAEAGSAFASRAACIVDGSDMRESRISEPQSGVLIVDTDSRYSPPTEARRRCRSALALSPGSTVLKKIDSALRGPVAAEVGALHADGGPVVVAPALPSLGRDVVNGVVRLAGVPLAESNAWAGEGSPAPTTVSAALRPLPTRPVSLNEVRAETATLAELLTDTAAAGAIAVCDGETDDDLDRIVRAGQLMRTTVRWVGSAGLAHALARSDVSAASPAADPPGSTSHFPNGPALFIVGTTARIARTQVSRLATRIPTVLHLEPTELLSSAEDHAADVAERTAGRDAVVSLTAGESHVSVPRSHDIARALARAVAPAVDTHGALYLSGGETARAVLRAVGIRTLRVRESREPGVVLSTAPDGRHVITKPGGFGDQDTLLRIADRLGIAQAQRQEDT